MNKIKEALKEMIHQFAYKNTTGGYYTGGLSALEDAFESLGLEDSCTKEELDNS